MKFSSFITKASLWTLAVVALLSSCKKDEDVPELRMNICGQIVDGLSQEPIDSVKIIYHVGNNELSTISHENGCYHISDLIPGKHVIVFSKNGYETQAVTVDVTEDLPDAESVSYVNTSFNLFEVAKNVELVSTKHSKDFVLTTNFNCADCPVPNPQTIIPTVTFTEAMDTKCASVSLDGRKMPASQISWSDGGRVLAVTPIEPFDGKTPVCLSISGLKTIEDKVAVTIEDLVIYFEDDSFTIFTSSLWKYSNGSDCYYKDVDSNESFSFTITTTEEIDDKTLGQVFVYEGKNRYTNSDVTIDGKVLTVTVPASEMRPGKTYYIDGNIYSKESDAVVNINSSSSFAGGRSLKFTTFAEKLPVVTGFAFDQSEFMYIYGGSDFESALDNVDYKSNRFPLQWEAKTGVSFYQIQVKSNKETVWRNLETVSKNGVAGDILTHTVQVNASVLDQDYTLENGTQITFRIRAVTGSDENATNGGDFTELGKWIGDKKAPSEGVSPQWRWYSLDNSYNDKDSFHEFYIGYNGEPLSKLSVSKYDTVSLREVKVFQDEYGDWKLSFFVKANSNPEYTEIVFKLTDTSNNTYDYTTYVRY